MTIVVGVVNAGVIAAIGAQILSSFVGNSFFGVANQQAA